MRAAMLIGLALLAPGAGVSAQSALPAVPPIGESDAIIADPLTGLALFGFDPVAYFVDGKAVLGDPQFTLLADGFVWRFVNPGNREAFKADRGPYLPAYGGYDPLDVAEGRLVPGLPDIFAVVGGRVMLFRNQDSRTAFLADAAKSAEAERRWSEVSRGLVHSR